MPVYYRQQCSLTSPFLFYYTGVMYDVTGSYTMAFILGGFLCILSAFFMIQPYLYVRNHPLSVDEEIIAEKMALAESADIHSMRYTSHRDLVQMAVSLESLSAAKHALELIHRSTASLHAAKPETKMAMKIKSNGMYLPIHKDIAALKLSFSTETI